MIFTIFIWRESRYSNLIELLQGLNELTVLIRFPGAGPGAQKAIHKGLFYKEKGGGLGMETSLLTQSRLCSPGVLAVSATGARDGESGHREQVATWSLPFKPIPVGTVHFHPGPGPR